MSDDLEQLLMSMPLVRPSASLDRRIAALLADDDEQHDGVLARLRPMFMAGGSLAAAAMIALLANAPAPTQTSTSTAAAGAVVRVEYEETWASVTPQGIVFVDDATPGYAYEREQLQQVTYIDPRNNVEVQWSWPTQETWFVPIEYQ